MLLEPGLHYGIDADVYHSDPVAGPSRPSLSASIATTLCNETPAHAYLRHPRLGGVARKTTAEMDQGSLVHALLLGAGKELVRVEEKDWRKNVAKDAREAAKTAGKLAMLADDIDAAELVVKILSAKLADRGIVLSGKSEVVMVWEEQLPLGEKVSCRGMLDHLILDRGKIWDLKTCASASPKKIEPKMTDFGYDIQHAAYVRGLGKAQPDLVGRADMGFIFCEVEAPYCITIVECDGELQDLGDRRWRRALSTWNDCLRLDRWPEYASGVVRLGPRPWAVIAEDDHGFHADF